MPRSGYFCVATGHLSPDNAPTRGAFRRVAALLLAVACAGCGGAHYATRWDGRRGYDGNGDYGYDLAASRSEARTYRARAAGAYRVPGTPEDPWRPYIREAASRFAVPERWIRAVMQQESGAQQYDVGGALTTSSAGAMGLMQVMPQTYDVLQQRYSLGSDPYEPRSNILAGTAYIREMYDRYGSPGFLAAYDAGPDRLDAYLSGGTPLPDETVNYVASVAPQLGTAVATNGPLAAYARSAAGANAGAVYAGGGMTMAQYRASVNRADTAVPASEANAGAVYAGGGMTMAQYRASVNRADTAVPAAEANAGAVYAGGGMTMAQYRASVNRADTAVPAAEANDGAVYAGGGMTMAQYRASVNRSPAAGRPPAQDAGPSDANPSEATVPAPAEQSGGGWAIQVGAYPDPLKSDAAIAVARAHAGEWLASTQPSVTRVQRDAVLYRARLVGLSASSALAACAKLIAEDLPCFTVPPGF